ncbi:hypothetical protein [Candidatus Methylomicrobium oryzae]|uniref:hypothetical protein n=1 Tax=Candidatus Methylomicrobium oryzae TaxID=2802053 RepID=UPI001920F269|nr:hypothetical protein [Methylomicrobium sp. RS1]MBL1263513.1 hypothetical protein [Methylomicrobium sp. RS1]
MHKILTLALLLAALWYAALAQAETSSAGHNGGNKSFPSCRTHFRLQQTPVSRSYTIAVDQTTRLSPMLVQDTVERVVRSLKPGDHVKIVTFSGMSQHYFTFIALELRIDVPPSEDEWDTAIPAAQVDAAKTCFTRQIALARSKVQKELTRLLSENLAHTPAKSEIFKAIHSIASITDPAVPEKILVAVSDLVENSDIAVLYRKHSLAVSDPKAVLVAVKHHGLLASLPNTKVYVVGAAFMPAPKNHVGLKQREALKSLWQAYFTAAKAQVLAWGDPALLSEIL